MKQDVQRFLELLKNDPALQEKLKAAGSFNSKEAQKVFEESVLPIAEEAGLHFTFDDLKAYFGQMKELDLEEMDEVAGGFNILGAFKSVACLFGGHDYKCVQIKGNYKTANYRFAKYVCDRCGSVSYVREYVTGETEPLEEERWNAWQ